MTTRKSDSRGPRGRGVSEQPGNDFLDLDLGLWLGNLLNPMLWLIFLGTALLIFIPVWMIDNLDVGSMGQSLILAGFIFVLCLGTAAAVLHFGRATPLKARWVAAGLAVGGLAFSAFAFQADYGQRATTLFEVEVEGAASAPAGGPAARELGFAVEHPGAEHTLMLWPKAPGLEAPASDVIVRVELRDPQGATVLEREEEFWVRHLESGSEWSSASLPFTPRQAGRYTLLVTPLTPGIPLVHVRVVDPLKRDGERMSGY